MEIRPQIRKPYVITKQMCLSVLSTWQGCSKNISPEARFFYFYHNRVRKVSWRKIRKFTSGLQLVLWRFKFLKREEKDCLKKDSTLIFSPSEVRVIALTDSKILLTSNNGFNTRLHYFLLKVRNILIFSIILDGLE